MNIDEIVYNDFYTATFNLRNTSDKVMYYDVIVYDKEIDGDILYKTEEVLGGKDYKNISAHISGIDPDVLETYRVCVIEKPKSEGGKLWGVVGRVCSKLRVYWPQARLQQLQ